MFTKLFSHNSSRFLFLNNAPTPAVAEAEITVENRRRIEAIEKKAEENPQNELYKEAKEATSLLKKNQIDIETFEEFADAVIDPNNSQDEGLKNLAIALKKRKFPKNAKGAFQFVRALKGNDNQKLAAREELLRLAEGEPGPISSRRYYEILRKARSPLNPASNAEVANLNAATALATNTHQQLEMLQDKMDNAHWQAEDPGGTIVADIQRLEGELRPMLTEANALMIKPKLSPAEKTRLEQLDELIPAKLHEIDTPVLAFRAHLEKQVKRKRTIERFSQLAGFDINDPNVRFRFDIHGSPELKIDGITFAPDNDDDPEITFHNHLGTQTTMSADGFIVELDTQNATPRVDDQNALQKAIGLQLGRKPLAVGDTFENVNNQVFRIQAILPTGDIQLDHEVNIRPASIIPNNTPAAPGGYRDDIPLSTLNLGQFARFIKKFNYHRVMRAAEMPTLIAENHRLQQEKDQLAASRLTDNQRAIYELVKSPSSPFVPPAAGETVDILYIKGNLLRQAKMTYVNDGGKDGYKMEEVTPETFDLQELQDAGVPRRMLNFPLAQIRSYTGNPPVISPWELIELAEDGNITRFKKPAETTPTPPEAPKDKDKDEKENTPPPEDEGKKKPIPGLSPKDQKKIDTEGVQYSESYIPGDLKHEEEGHVQKLWASTNFYSLWDFVQLGKDIKEYWGRGFERKKSERVAKLGERLPLYAQDFRTKRTSAESQSVNQYKDSMSQMDPPVVVDILHSSTNKDEVKACLMYLAEKGQLRWDDVEMWRSINQFAPTEHKIPIPADENPYTVDKKTNTTGFDYLEKAIDNTWDKGTFSGWSNGNNSAFESGKGNYKNEIDDKGSRDNGYVKELSQMLQDHKNGTKWVDPQRYEGYISHAIENGKSSMDVKIFYLIQGVTMKGQNGRTLLNIERLRALNAKHLGHFPIIDFFTEGIQRYELGKKDKDPYKGEPEGKVKKTNVTQFDVDEWAKMVSRTHAKDKEDRIDPQFVPGHYANRFLWDYILTSKRLQDRLDKMMRGSGSTIDHDDTQAFGPFLTVTVLKNFSQSSPGNHKATSLLGYMNIYAGLSQGLKTLAVNGNPQRLAQVMNNFFIYDGIMRGRYEKNEKTYQRWPDDDYFTREYGYLRRSASKLFEEYKNLMGEIFNRYEAQFGNDPAKMKTIAEARRIFAEGTDNQQALKRDQTEYSKMMDGFQTQLNEILAMDKGEILLQTSEEFRQKGDIRGIFDYEDEPERK